MPKGSRGRTNGTHAVVNEARTQATLDDLQPHEPSCLQGYDEEYLEALAPSEHQVAYWDADIVVNDFTMTFGCIIVSKYLHWADDFDTGRISRNEDDTLLLVAIGVGRIALSHKNMNFTPGITSSANPPETKIVSTSRYHDLKY